MSVELGHMGENLVHVSNIAFLSMMPEAERPQVVDAGAWGDEAASQLGREAILAADVLSDAADL